MNDSFKLLSRDEFRNMVFERDQHKCLVCQAPAQDSHHIIERRLFENGGYYLENGASVCGACHLKAEQTLISCDELRQLAGITKFPLPEHFYRDQQYDKWGNIILPNGNRVKGELFNDASVQKVLEPVLHLFSNQVKYPRTFHLPWSPGATSDDRVLENVDHFVDKEVVVTLKADGENTSLYRDYLHARSLDYHPHPSRDWVKALHARIAYNIPEGWRVCAENVWAVHSIKYSHLEDYLLVFSIWDENNICLSWDDTLLYSELLELKTVPVLYRGLWNEELIKGLYQEVYDGDEMEGYVVRLAEKFHYRDFRKSIAKMVRPNHVQTHGHWMRAKLERNELRRP